MIVICGHCFAGHHGCSGDRCECACKKVRIEEAADQEGESLKRGPEPAAVSSP